MRPLVDSRLPPLLLGLLLAPGLIASGQAQTPPPSAPASRDESAALPGRRPASETGAGSGGGAAPLADAGGSAIGWSLAPVRWSGNLTLDWRSLSFDQQARRQQQVEMLNLRAASYIWQPWFVQLSGSLAVGLSQSSSSGSAAQGLLAADDRASSRAINASLAVNVFPQSRFPFNGSWTTTDSRTSDSLSASDSRADRLSLRQSYRNPQGDTSYSAMFDRSTISGNTLGTDRVDVLQATVTRRLPDQQFDAIALRTQNERSQDGGGSNSTRLSVMHSYRRDEDLLISSSVSDSATRLRVGLGDTLFASRLRFRQLSSIATWTPDVPTPVLVTGAVRWTDSATTSQSGEAESTSASARALAATATATWRPVASLFLGGAVTVSQFASGAQNQTLTAESLSAGYTFDQKEVLGYTYLASVNGALQHQSGGDEGSRVQTTQNLAQTLSRSFPLSDTTSLGTSFNQSVVLRQDSLLGNNQTLLHNASLNLRYFSNEGMAAFGSLSLGDSRTTGVSPATFQMVNLQLSGQMPFGRYSSASGNLTMQMIRQSSQLAPDEGWRSFATGGFAYQHTRVFGVPRLRYFALANAFNSQVNARINGDPNAPRENVAWTHEQRLEYNLGRLEFRLSARLARVDGKKNALLFLRVSRSFGSI